MKKRFQIITLLVFVSITGHSAVPAPEKLLPDETLGVLTVPDYAKASAAYNANASSQVWRDPALKPFREKLVNKFNEEVIKPLERELGVKLNDYSDLARGQLTFAVLQNGWQGKDEPLPAWLLLVDTRDKSPQLKTNLADLRKKWVDSGKKLKTEKIRDVEFVTLTVSGADVARALEKSLSSPGADKGDKEKSDDNGPEAKNTITVGQSETLLIVGNNPKAIEKILARQSGGAVQALGEQSAFDADYQARFRNALIYGWVHFKPLAAILNRLATDAANDGDKSPNSPDWTKVVPATGLGGLQTISFSFNETPDGSFGEVHFRVPAAARVGLFKMIAADLKDSNPPPFVPGDAVKFQRFRLDFQKAWNTLESMLTEISPQMGGGLKLIMETAGKDKDPNFDLRKELIGNLGDDFISYTKNPRSNTFAGLSAAPSIFLLGSPNAEKLAAALKTVTSLLPPQLTSVKERELLGRKVYSLTLPGGPNPDGSMSQRNLSFSASGGYLALSTDEAILESYLRSGDNTGKTLREVAGLADAAQKIGGMSTGWFGYENTSETMRVTLDALKNDSGTVEKVVGVTPLAGWLKGKDGKGLKEWVDFSLLPPFDQIAKYFYFTVYSGGAGADGLTYKIFSPTPPQLKK